MKKRQPSKMQLRAVTHVRGPAIVIAGPGSGKTFTVIQRILYLICNAGINPDKILTITFTKAAAMEMQRRYQKEAKENPILSKYRESVQFGTFHSICYHILKDSKAARGFSLIKESEKRKILEILLQNENAAQDMDYDKITDVIDAISRRKNKVQSDPPAGLSGERFEKLLRDYEEMTGQRRLLDFDDMIAKCLSALREDSAFCRRWQERFSHILVDEFQDINEPQYEVVKLLSAPSFHLFAVGDDDQSIYGFRGAVPRIMKSFIRDFPDAAQLFLTENYRSGREIVNLADCVISGSKDRFSKNMLPMREGGRIRCCFEESRKEEEKRLLSDIGHLSKEELDDSALIVRTNLEAFQYGALLTQNGIRIRQELKAFDPLQHFIMEDFAAFLRFCREGGRRKDFLKIMNKPNLYLSRQALVEENVTGEGLLAFYRNNAGMQDEVRRLFDRFRIASGLSPYLAVRFFRKVMGYDEYLKKKAKSRTEAVRFEETAGEIQELMRKMKPQESVDDFRSRLEEEAQGDKAKEKTFQPGISVITMHGAKGLEFSGVFLPDLNEGVIPGRKARSPEEVEEERRLLYVAITRARNSLYLYYTRERNRKLTRFLEGITLPRQ